MYRKNKKGSDGILKSSTSLVRQAQGDSASTLDGTVPGLILADAHGRALAWAPNLGTRLPLALGSNEIKRIDKHCASGAWPKVGLGSAK